MCVCLMAIVVALSQSISSSLKPIEALDKSCWQDSKRTFITELHIYFVVYFHLRSFFLLLLHHRHSSIVFGFCFFFCILMVLVYKRYKPTNKKAQVSSSHAHQKKKNENTRNITARKCIMQTHHSHCHTATEPQSCREIDNVTCALFLYGCYLFVSFRFTFS